MEGTNIVRSDDLRNENRRRLINALRSNGPSSPTSLANDTGLSAASISSLTSQLADQGVVRSNRQKNQEGIALRGRPQSLIELNCAAGDIITLNLAIDLIRVHRVDYGGQILQNRCIEVMTRDLSEPELMGLLLDAIKQLMQTDSENSVQCIGVAFQGMTEHLSGTLQWSPIIEHQHVRLGAALETKFQLPVSVNNDCRLISEALSRQHQALLGSSFATVIFSHGVGLGLHIGGQPFAGIRSSALEMGHLRFERDGALCRCGKLGCIEAYAADYGILRLAAGESIQDKPPGRLDGTRIRAICSAAGAGDEAAIQAFAIAGAAIGDGLATVFTLFDSMPVALVGRSQNAVNLMLPGLKSAFRDMRGDTLVMQDMLHCFDDENPLLESGLIHNTLAKADLQFAYGS